VIQSFSGMSESYAHLTGAIISRMQLLKMLLAFWLWTKFSSGINTTNSTSFYSSVCS